MESDGLVLLSKIVAILMLVAFLPLTAVSFFRFRRHRRHAELERIFRKLRIAEADQRIHTASASGWHFALSVGFASMISSLGLAVLLLGRELGLANTPSILLGGAGVMTASAIGAPIDPELWRYQSGGLLVFGMGFLGAYLWGLQMIVRRYTLNDLVSAAYYHLGVRMIAASVIALLVYHSTDGGRDGGEILGQHLLPVVAFMVGMFPQRGLHWIKQRVQFLMPKANSAVRDLPLEMIEGMSRYDRIRLEELGIESCHDLAASDFIPLLLKTPYGAREIIDWLLQAKLCVHFGAQVERLRDNGIRIITDLAPLQVEELEELVAASGVSLFSLRKAREAVIADADIKRLCVAGRYLSQYWDGEAPPTVAGGPDPDILIDADSQVTLGSGEPSPN